MPVRMFLPVLNHLVLDPVRHRKSLEVQVLLAHIVVGQCPSIPEAPNPVDLPVPLARRARKQSQPNVVCLQNQLVQKERRLEARSQLIQVVLDLCVPIVQNLSLIHI